MNIFGRIAAAFDNFRVSIVYIRSMHLHGGSRAPRRIDEQHRKQLETAAQPVRPPRQPLVINLGASPRELLSAFRTSGRDAWTQTVIDLEKERRKR
jgi:hypothetical protein